MPEAQGAAAAAHPFADQYPPSHRFETSAGIFVARILFEPGIDMERMYARARITPPFSASEEWLFAQSTPLVQIAHQVTTTRVTTLGLEVLTRDQYNQQMNTYEVTDPYSFEERKEHVISTVTYLVHRLSTDHEGHDEWTLFDGDPNHGAAPLKNQATSGTMSTYTNI